jgi:RES domain-containing protein
VIYAASSLALCALEVLASRGSELPQDLIAVKIELPDDIPSSTVTTEDLAPDWWKLQNLARTREIGSDWVRKLKTAVLKVPSAVIRQECNYILNPAHPKFERIRFGETVEFMWDERLKR